MGFVIKYLKVGIFISFLFISTAIFAQPPFTPPGQGGNPPGNPCPGPPGTPCPQIPITGGIGFLIVAGMIIGIRKIYRSDNQKDNK